ncbi:DNA replication licensing factor mcm6-like [Leptopilina heterotoma]|uniref:DNA replication licensing factor mcm6-like n=1 Tax=Leptopilina heterotoma TaxID=63436 RepID=UPI001CA85BBD|nr:DNA replication licensing factor mcm6-like [Leptopilina heterotoma]XP_043462797.1 DNA replication licensing factor mcm6-like [Leptopilina heterotoma]XP_043462798.1 DNA replication licensing factor mcm6-like [Leptopilina heterotoma]
MSFIHFLKAKKVTFFRTFSTLHSYFEKSNKYLKIYLISFYFFYRIAEEPSSSSETEAANLLQQQRSPIRGNPEDDLIIAEEPSSSSETEAANLPQQQRSPIRGNPENDLMQCGPRLDKDAGEFLSKNFVQLRQKFKEHELATDKQLSIQMTIRQLESIIRISESLAKMKLKPFATKADVTEAFRLFYESTVLASTHGSLKG